MTSKRAIIVRCTSLIIGALMMSGYHGPAMGVPSQASNARLSGAMKDFFQFASCTLKRSEGTARSLLVQMVGTAEERAHLEELISCGCSGTTAFRFSGLELRATLYNLLYVKDFGATAVNIAAHQPAFPVSDDPEGHEDKYVRSYKASVDAGTCVAMGAPQVAHSLLTAKIGSRQEREGVQALAPLVEGCTPEGVHIPIDAAAMRGLVAEPMYRLSELARKNANA